MDISSSGLRVFPFFFSILLEVISLPFIHRWTNKFEDIVEDNSGRRTDTEWITDAAVYYLLEHSFWTGLFLTLVTVLVISLQSSYSILWTSFIVVGVVAHRQLRPDDYSIDATAGILGLRVPEIIMIAINLSYVYIFY